jgi:hypothetical protein
MGSCFHNGREIGFEQHTRWSGAQMKQSTGIGESQTEMDGQQDTDTYYSQKVQPYILRESDELAETTVVADNANAKRV